MLKDSLIEWSNANYNDLILDDYLLFGNKEDAILFQLVWG